MLEPSRFVTWVNGSLKFAPAIADWTRTCPHERIISKEVSLHTFLVAIKREVGRLTNGFLLPSGPLHWLMAHDLDYNLRVV